MDFLFFLLGMPLFHDFCLVVKGHCLKKCPPPMQICIWLSRLWHHSSRVTIYEHSALPSLPRETHISLSCSWSKIHRWKFYNWIGPCLHQSMLVCSVFRWLRIIDNEQPFLPLIFFFFFFFRGALSADDRLRSNIWLWYAVRMSSFEQYVFDTLRAKDVRDFFFFKVSTLSFFTKMTGLVFQVSWSI